MIYNKVGFTDGRTVTAETILTLESSTGASSLYIVNSGALGLSSGTGIVIQDIMTGATKDKPLVMNADNDSNSSGTLTVATSKLVDSNALVRDQCLQDGSRLTYLASTALAEGCEHDEGVEAETRAMNSAQA